MTADAVHHAILIVDIEGFGRPERTDHIRRELRHQLYRLVKESLEHAGVGIESWRSEDRGDGILVLVTADVPKTQLLDAWILWLTAGLRRYNGRSSPQARMRLRAAAHMGEVARDETGLVGTDLNDAFRLLDCDGLRDALDSSSGDLAVIVSDPVYQSVVKADAGLIDPNEYDQVAVSVKELDTFAWVIARRGARAGSTGHSQARTPSKPEGRGGIVFNGETRVEGDVVGRDKNQTVTYYGGQRERDKRRES